VCNLLRYKERVLEPYRDWEFSDIRIKPAIRFKVAPSEPVPVIIPKRRKKNEGAAEGNDLPMVTMMGFGLASSRGRQMMARGETVERLPMFREAFRSQRCLILANGFYDSLDMGAYKQPWHIHLKDDETMTFAGIWESGPEGDNFAIVSAPANKVVGRVIDRMPVILPRKHWRQWLAPETPAEELKAMLLPFPDDRMEAYPVTRMVNKKGFEGPECMEPVVPDQGELNMF
jgi:putative SOS response-associated peptidase YedK